MLRVVGLISVASNQIAATQSQIGAMGMIVVTDIALAAGAASIPGPVTDAADDGWFVFVPISQEFGFSTAASWQANFAIQYHFDSKAKRVVSDGQSIAVMAENAHATHGFNIVTAFRMLSMVRGT